MADNNASKRGLASADQETRKRVAREGGKASHGGGRR
jgi:general stress protein YciG